MGKVVAGKAIEFHHRDGKVFNLLNKGWEHF